MCQYLCARYTSTVLISREYIATAVISIFSVHFLVAVFSVGSITMYVAPQKVEASYGGSASTSATVSHPKRVEVAPGTLALDEASVVKSRETADSQEGEVAPASAEHTDAREVPFYSQFTDISSPQWRAVGCGIAATAMLVDYFTEDMNVSVDALLNEGIASGAYLQNAGWIHAGLIALAEKRGLRGSSVSLANLSPKAALIELENVLVDGPVMASVYYTFTPGHPIPHLVVINDIVGDTVYYNDPAEPSGGGSISVEKFLPAWKQRYIEIRPVR